MCSNLMPASLPNSTADRGDAAPTPEEPKVNPSGRPLARRIRSAVELPGSFGLTTSRYGGAAPIAIGASTLLTSNGPSPPADTAISAPGDAISQGEPAAGGFL